jgi:hypothetical protein
VPEHTAKVLLITNTVPQMLIEIKKTSCDCGLMLSSTYSFLVCKRINCQLLYKWGQRNNAKESTNALKQSEFVQVRTISFTETLLRKNQGK